MSEYNQIFLYISVGALAIFARVLLALERITFLSFLRTAITGAFIGLVIGIGLLEDTELNPYIKWGLFGIAVSLAEDIIVSVLAFGREVRKNPMYLWQCLRRFK